MDNNIQSGTRLDSSLNDKELDEHIKENTAKKLFTGCEEREGLPVISMDKLMSRLKELGFKNAVNEDGLEGRLNDYNEMVNTGSWLTIH